MPTSRIEDAALEQRLEDGVRVVDAAEQHEVAVAAVRAVAERRQLGERCRSRCTRMSSTMASISRAWARAAVAAAWVSADRWYGRRTSRRASVDRRVGGEVADAGAGEGERLAHGARDEQALAPGQQA